MGGKYDVAQVCMNGHVINEMVKRHPEDNADHCEDCGEKTITACPSCGQEIPGHDPDSSVIVLSTRAPKPPAFCRKCGKPYPWTERKLGAARELALELEGLSPEEREKLAGSLDDLLTNTPQTQVAANRFKRAVGKAGKSAAGALRDIMVDVMSEAAKKIVLGPGA